MPAVRSDLASHNGRGALGPAAEETSWELCCAATRRTAECTSWRWVVVSTRGNASGGG
jgi:hypothetical protein